MVTRSFFLKFGVLLCVWTPVLLMITTLFRKERTYIYDNQFIRSTTQTGESHPTIFYDHEIFPEPSDAELLNVLAAELPNTPLAYWTRHENKTMRLNATCANKPNLLNIDYHNNYWQTFRIENATFQLFGAYYDNRTSLEKRPLVRILAMGRSLQMKQERSFCQMWFDEQTKPMIVPVATYKPFWLKSWGTGPKLLYPYLLSCQLPTDYQAMVPKTISLVRKVCDTADNNLRVSYELPPSGTKQDFAVCVKGLDFPYIDISARLIEWLELLRLLGVDKVYTYKLSVHPNMQKVLDYYVARDFVELHPLSLATGDPNLFHFQHLVMKYQYLKKRLNEVIPYNDCFYRNMNKYKYIALLDVDEVIMPLGNLTTWQELVDIAKHRQLNESTNCPYGYASICYHNVHFSALETNLAHNYVAAQGGVDKAFYMLNHVARSTNHSKPGYAVKCFHNTTEVETLHNHFSLSWLKSCRPIELENNQAQLQHYRIAPDPKEGELVLDVSVWRFKHRLVEQAYTVLGDLGFLR